MHFQVVLVERVPPLLRAGALISTATAAATTGAAEVRRTHDEVEARIVAARNAQLDVLHAERFAKRELARLGIALLFGYLGHEADLVVGIAVVHAAGWRGAIPD